MSCGLSDVSRRPAGHGVHGHWCNRCCIAGGVRGVEAKQSLHEALTPKEEDLESAVGWNVARGRDDGEMCQVPLGVRGV